MSHILCKCKFGSYIKLKSEQEIYSNLEIVDIENSSE